MAWSQTDIDKLKAAMAKGTKVVRYASGSVEYQSIDDMRKLLADMQRDVDAAAGASVSSRRVAQYFSGF